MTRKEIREFGQHIVDKVFHKREQDNIIVVKGWIARDANHKIYFYNDKPSKVDSQWLGKIGEIFVKIDNNSFPQVVWEDNEPTPCEVMIKIEK